MEYNKENHKKSELALREEELLKFWQEHDIFQKTLDQESPQGEFVFYEGPPTANGRPGIHHLAARAFKDAIPRYKTMQGFHVRRKAGWDTHGLPVELEVEKQLGLKSKHEIEEYGIAEFNKKCKESVWTYLDEWQAFTDRAGYWIDMEHPYVTYDPKYVESVWWVFKQIADQDLLYKDYRVAPWCMRCGTTLSSHELAQGYKDVKDISITAKFLLLDNEEGVPSVVEGENSPSTSSGYAKTYVLAWTTTPWTLPGNVALAVGAKIVYVKIKIEDEFFILAKERLETIQGEYEVIEEFTGDALVGKSYKPLFPYFQELAQKNDIKNLENAYKIYAADFVTTEDGTGVVHTAVMYGADDFELGTVVGLPKFHMVNTDGTFIDGAGFLSGRSVKEETDGKPTMDIDIIKYLQEHNTFFAKEKYEHSYPHCWRCKTPLIYYARDSWYFNMQDVKQKLIDENQEINWQPEYVRDGRFGEWLRDLKDWSISRERYWGTPMPVWESPSTSSGQAGERLVIGSYEELKKYAKKSKNNYTFIRHGESLSNREGFLNSEVDRENPLTEKGREQVSAALDNLKKQNITKIYVSPLQRTQETAEIIREGLGLDPEHVIMDERLREFHFGELEGNDFADFVALRDQELHFGGAVPSGESYRDVTIRLGEFLKEKEAELEGESVLIVGHGCIAEAAHVLEFGYNDTDAWEHFHDITPGNAEVRPVNFDGLPRNERLELDPHRPYVDDIILEKDGKEFRRVVEVVDVWFDSGSMPFAQDHHPFDSAELRYPADFISEGMDQTRGWFYTMHAIGNLLGKGKAYKNIISLGLINDEHGQKMSKSKGNAVNPWEAMATFGADTIRFWMYSVSGPGDAKSFDEKTLIETQRKVFGLLGNVVKFYEMYADQKPSAVSLQPSANVLDQWILARLGELVQIVTEKMDEYQLLEPTRAIRDFIADLSQWYIRRSRDRFKSEDQEDRQNALATTKFVLIELSKLMAPFTPFFAEDIYQRAGGVRESVHLENWPIRFADAHSGQASSILEDMQKVREIISLALQERDKAGIKVRQPLQSLTITQNLDEQYLALIRDEVNVKEILAGKELALDVVITQDLAAEGNVRELIRQLQSMRKKAKLNPDQMIDVTIDTDAAGEQLVNDFENEIKKVAGINAIHFTTTEGDKIQIDSLVFVIQLQIHEREI